MKKSLLLISFLALVIISQNAFSQNRNSSYKMEGSNPKVLTLNQTYTTSGEIYPFDKTVPKFFGLSFTGSVVFEDETSEVRLLLVDKDFNEYLVYESYPLLEQGTTVPAEDVSEETALLDGVQAYSLRIELVNARVTIKQLTYTTGLGQVTNISELRAEKKRLQDEDKISRLNRNLKERGQGWVAGPTEVSGLSYSEKQQLFGNSTFPAGFEYYSGGVITTGSTTLKSASSTSPYARVFDWRNRHGQNWITPVVNQGICGSCWAFAATGATEALVNVFYNQLLNLNLSEQDVLSCSGAGDCNGGYPSTALAYITGTGVVDEGAFPYSGTKEACTNKSSTPSERIKIGGRVDFGSTLYPRTEDDLKRMLIEMGPLSGGLYDWSHAMVMVGYQVVQEGDVFYYRDLNLSRYWKTVSAGDPLIGKTVWIFKNSWSDRFGDKGYVYVETPITNIGWTHGLKTPVMSLVKSYNVVCEDRDGDGYYWWGLGPKPAGCDCPEMADGDDSDPTLGPLDAYGNCTPLNASPVADFKASATSVTSGQSVSFSDLSVNNPVSWSWQFEGGTPATSTAKNPSVTYSTAGDFRVTLTVTNANGSNTKSVDNYIVAQANLPVANFTASVTNITVGQSVSFSDLSTNNPVSWSWQFEGGTPSTSTAKNPSVTYSTAGDFRVTLTVTNASGSNTKSVDNFIVAQANLPVANFTANVTNITVGQSVSFSDLSTNNPVSWNWQFEGGTPSTSTAKNPSVTYSTAGDFRVTLTVTNASGSNTKSVDNYITVSEVVIEETVVSYCTPAGISSSPDYIKNVTVGTFLNNTSSGNGYSLFPNEISMNAGARYSISLTPQVSTNRNFWKIWIDLNGDGDFDDAGETILSIVNKKGVYKGTLTIPTIAAGTTRMRIAMRTGSAPSPCDGYYAGEVEDYTVTILPASNLKSAFIESPEPSDVMEVRMYPNPVQQELTVQLSSTSSDDHYTLFSMNGQKLESKQINGTHTTVDFSQFPAGIYFMVVVNHEQVIREKIVKR